ncbi:hypothetical protein [Saccharothrix longispora]|uniref:hypothetical protein n=1 Tax=Saccharothrix longispora TaxID=33920 RepID=UPI0028FD0255|nr:hypothetical protein [Saccharothrix longispora]MDU0292618.1 hypothetical protein [Saccharothrix longispora]
MSTDRRYLDAVLRLSDALFDAADTDGDDQVDRRPAGRARLLVSRPPRDPEQRPSTSTSRGRGTSR